MEQEERKNKRKSIAEWIAVFLCIAASSCTMYHCDVCYYRIGKTMELYHVVAGNSVSDYWSYLLYDYL